MGRFIVVVLDSLGIGYMKDVKDNRPQDIGANTCKHILEAKPKLKLKNLEELGLINALGEKVGIMNYSNSANFGRVKLMHYGGDTFFGHQELMGSLPKKPLIQPFQEVIDKVYEMLIIKGYEVEYIGDNLKYLLVNQAIAIGDNLEADLGQVYNLTTTFDKVSLEDLMKVAKEVRSIVRVARVIAFGGRSVKLEDITAAKEEKNGKYIGINAPKSGVYNEGYEVRHLGYGIDSQVQIQSILGRSGIEIIFVGKVADIVENPYGKSYEGIVDTKKVFEVALKELEGKKDGYFCINIQETDLAGHQEDVDRYADRLELADRYIGKLRQLLTEQDILIVTADHGNDPSIGHSKHTREYVPLLIDKKEVYGIEVGTRDSLSDIGASIAEYFSVENPENGRSFYSLLKNS